MKKMIGSLAARPWIVMPVVALVALGGWWAWKTTSGSSSSSAAADSQVVEVTSGPMSQVVTSEGTVAVAEQQDASFSASGTVTAVNVVAGPEGDRRRGARLDRLGRARGRRRLRRVRPRRRRGQALRRHVGGRVLVAARGRPDVGDLRRGPARRRPGRPGRRLAGRRVRRHGGVGRPDRRPAARLVGHRAHVPDRLGHRVGRQLLHPRQLLHQRASEPPAPPRRARRRRPPRSSWSAPPATRWSSASTPPTFEQVAVGDTAEITLVTSSSSSTGGFPGGGALPGGGAFPGGAAPRRRRWIGHEPAAAHRRDRCRAPARPAAPSPT